MERRQSADNQGGRFPTPLHRYRPQLEIFRQVPGSKKLLRMNHAIAAGVAVLQQQPAGGLLRQGHDQDLVIARQQRDRDHTREIRVANLSRQIEIAAADRYPGRRIWRVRANHVFTVPWRLRRHPQWAFLEFPTQG
jgi:hypothetical protein